MAKSMRQRMFESATHDMAKDLGNTLADLSRDAQMTPIMYARCKKPLMIPNCYLCGTHDDIIEVEYGQSPSNHSNIIWVCPQCKKWLGEFLLSDDTQATKVIEESEESE